MLEISGIASRNQIKEIFPSMESINNGPVAVIECFQEIPCNPCTTSCKFNAISMGDKITNLPSVKSSNCVGCGICLGKCPGLAIMLVDGSKSDKYIYMSIPYEMLPLPIKGDIVRGLDREGKFLSEIKVIKVLSLKSFDRTIVITLEVPRKFLYEFRNIEMGEK